MSTDSLTIAEMRAALAAVIDQTECGLLAWSDIGEAVENRLPTLRALCAMLAAATEPPPANPNTDRTLEHVGWYRAYDTWRFGEAKPISSRYEFHNGVERPSNPDDEGNADWEPVYLINTAQATRP